MKKGKKITILGAGNVGATIAYTLALDGMASALQKEYGGLPMLFAGGVMSNRLIREALTEKYGAVFAEPAFSSDNAAGIAVLTEMKRCGAC